ncbi:MAG: ROK family protein [Anaerolineae bacterium]|jgi:polyphosphate glucokinase|nr:ROK family protein [Anaerolineae bacterium]
MKVLGIDIGGSGIKGAPVDTKSGELLEERFRLVTPQPSTPAAVAEVVGEVARHFKWRGAVGCGFPAVVQHGVTMTAANVDAGWIGADAAKLLAKATDCPVVVLNDADAAGIAEMKFGAGERRKGLVLIVTIGTGLGTALFIDGRLVPNTELGHIELRGEDAEVWASDAARERKELSWEAWALYFNEYLVKLERLVWPDLIILGGGASKKFDLFCSALTVKAEVVPAEMRNEAGIVGAALAFRKLHGK